MMIYLRLHNKTNPFREVIKGALSSLRLLLIIHNIPDDAPELFTLLEEESK